MTQVNGGRGRLKSLDLQGYKTFASKAIFEFAPGITAIVGPNGSGKSNIADSIRWVLGEQSYGLLRGKKTEDMIFSGSEQRARAGMATATITFDNSDGWLPIDFSEVTVGRRAYRSGENEYLLNGQRVRLRDVAELLAQCGLGERTYTIIGQGLVDAALSLKAEERRRLFEEAAGIGLYRGRRDEALRRLDHTRRNLDRVKDILTELRPRLRSLERQAKRAQDYELVRQDLHAALRDFYGHHWYRMLAVVAEARRLADEEAGRRESMHGQERTTSSELDATRARIEGLRLELQRLSQQSSTIYREREEIGRALAVAQERLRWVGEQAVALGGELEALASGEQALMDRLEAARAEVVERERVVADAEAQRRELLGEPSAGVEPDETELDADRARLRLDGLRAEIAANEARLAQAREAGEGFRLELEQAQARVSRSQEVAATSRQRLDHAEATAAEAARVREGKAAAESAAMAEVESAQRALEAHEASLSQSRTGLAAAEARLAQIDDLSETDAENLLSQASARGDLRGWHGRLTQAIRPQGRVEVAVRAALGAFVNGFGFESGEAIDSAATQFEEGGEAPSAAFLALERRTEVQRIELGGDDGIIGNAAALAEASGRYQPVIDALLGRTLVVRDRQTARRLLTALPEDARLVTLKGDIFLPGGDVLLNAARPHQGREETRRRLTAAQEDARGKLARAESEHNSLATRLADAQARAKTATEDLQRSRLEEQTGRDAVGTARAEERVASTEVDFAEEQLRAIDRRLAETQARLMEEEATTARLQQELRQVERVVRVDDVRRGGEAAAAHLAHAETTVQMARAALAEAADRLDELEETAALRKAELDQRRARAQALETERERLAEQVAESEAAARSIEEQLAAVEAQTAPVGESLTSAEEERSTLEKKESELRLHLQGIERAHSQAQIDLARRQEELASLRRRVEDDFGLVAFDLDESAEAQAPIPFEGLVEHLPQVEDLPPDFENQVARLRLQLRRMGAINPEAQKEYLEVRERVEFLTTQVEDLEQAEAQLQGVIAELDVQMETEFQKTFEAVSREFKDVFTRLFGGGSVRLTLTDPGDLSQTGIDIEARLPGRREQGLAMLSGGERSLTACALVFALLRVSPTPFCVLDEVDAMLDESNVARFREMLKELSEKTQFVIITHNRQTVQAAQVLYGVSMGPDSASRVISLQLDEAVRELAE